MTTPLSLLYFLYVFMHGSIVSNGIMRMNSSGNLMFYSQLEVGSYPFLETGVTFKLCSSTVYHHQPLCTWPREWGNRCLGCAMPLQGIISEAHGLSLLYCLLHLQLTFSPLFSLKSLLFLFDFAVFELLAVKTHLGLHESNFDVSCVERKIRVSPSQFWIIIAQSLRMRQCRSQEPLWLVNPHFTFSVHVSSACARSTARHEILMPILCNSLYLGHSIGS